MKTIYIIEELSKILTQEQIKQINIDLQNKSSLTLCFTITEIAKNYNGSDENELYVQHLLEKLCKKHFSLKKTKEEKLLKSLEKLLKSKGVENTDKYISHMFPNIVRLCNSIQK